MLMRLWRFQTNNSVPDSGWQWFFWQSSPPYKLKGAFGSFMVPSQSGCEVYSLGGRERLWSGVLADVPVKYRSYLTEVRVKIVRPFSPPQA